MATFQATKKRKLYLQLSPHSVSIEFQPRAASLSASLPDLFLRVSRGSRATETSPAKLQEGLSGSTTYRVSWSNSVLPLNLVLAQDETSGQFQSKEIKVQLKIASEGKSSNKSLASCAYDVTCLNLSALNYVGASSETRQISLSMGKSAAATAAIRAITVEATFHYKFLQDDFDISVEQSQSRETSPSARSPPPVNTLSDIAKPHHSSTDVNTEVVRYQQTQAQPEQGSGETYRLHNLVMEDPNSTLKSKSQQPQDTRSQGDRPPKPCRKTFQKKGSSGPTSEKHELIPTSQSIPSSNEPPTANSSIKVASTVEDHSDHPINTASTPNEILEETQSNFLRDTIEIPPKPKPRLQAGSSSDPQFEPLAHSEESSEVCVTSDSMEKLKCRQSDCQQQKPVHSEGSTDDRTRPFSSPAFGTKKPVNNNKTLPIDVHDHEECTQKPVLPKYYHPRSNRQSSPTPSVVSKTRGLSKHISGSTPHLSTVKLKHGRRSSSVSHLAITNRERSPKPSLSDLIKPTALASHSRVSEGCLNTTHISTQSDDQYLGIMKVRLKAVNTSDDFQSQTSDRQCDIQQPQAVKEGLCCIFTIGDGNGRFMSSVKLVVPRRTISWENEEMLFYVTPQSKKMFVLCRKITLEGASVTSVANTWSTHTANGKCIGAAVLEISTVRRCSSSPADDMCDYICHVECQDNTLPMQPKGTMLLQSCFYVLQPRYKVTCSGSVTIEALSGLHCNPGHDLSCTVKIDADFQGDTEPQQADQCANSGWCNEPVSLKACSSFDCSLQIWAYSSEETEYWCGGCVVPLALLLPDVDIRRHTTKGTQDNDCSLSTHINKTITLPVEPKGIIRLSFSLDPSIRSPGHIKFSSPVYTPKEDAQLVHQSTSLPTQPIGQTVTKRGSLRRVTVRRAGNFSLTVLKSYCEEPFHAEEDGDKKNDYEEQMMDLKKEVEFLREELRLTKAKLAESEFYREQAQLELKSLKEDATHLHTNTSKHTKKVAKPIQRRK